MADKDLMTTNYLRPLALQVDERLPGRRPAAALRDSGLEDL